MQIWQRARWALSRWLFDRSARCGTRTQRNATKRVRGVNAA